jgi:hypothetical protein
MGFNLGNAFKDLGKKIEDGTKSLVNIGISKPAEILGGATGSLLAPVAQSGALQAVTTGAVGAFTGGAAPAVGGLAALGGQGAGTFSGISDLLRSLTGGNSAPGGSSISPVTSFPASQPQAASTGYPAWLMPVLIGGGILAAVLAFFALRRK